MKTDDFDYHLPKDLIAQTPVEPRDSSKLLVLNRQVGSWEHRRFPDLLDCLQPGDVLVVNNSRVFPARILARREDTGGTAEILLLRNVQPDVWEAIGKPGRRLVPGARLIVENGSGDQGWIEVMAVGGDGTRTVRLSPGISPQTSGRVALPPYIHTSLADPERYQTIYSRESGSVAAPTAGLHFTPELLESIGAKGVEVAQLTLHVGPDTFLPIRTEDPRTHKLQGEYFHIGEEAASQVNDARRRGGRVVAVGTTSVRTLEQAALTSEELGMEGLVPMAGKAELYIMPGHRFRMVDAMVTNFHLPRSTLLMLVSAFAGRELILKAYQEAVEQRYRFYSFGDAMLIL